VGGEKARLAGTANEDDVSITADPCMGRPTPSYVGEPKQKHRPLGWCTILAFLMAKEVAMTRLRATMLVALCGLMLWGEDAAAQYRRERRRRTSRSPHQRLIDSAVRPSPQRSYPINPSQVNPLIDGSTPENHIDSAAPTEGVEGFSYDTSGENARSHSERPIGEYQPYPGGQNWRSTPYKPDGTRDYNGTWGRKKWPPPPPR
jgi:hypothetical protein